MSVIHVEEGFAILDEQIYYNKIFGKLNVEIRSELYEINSKFMPDSQFQAMKKRGIPNRKRKMRKEEKPEETTWIQGIASEIQKIGLSSGYFTKLDSHDNNEYARSAAEKALLVKTPPKRMASTQVIEFESIERMDNLMCNGIISNWISCSENSPGIIEDSENHKFYIPPGATFHVGDVTDVEQYSVLNEVLFDLVIADPPWFSLSVKRKKTYKMDEQVLNNLHLPSFTTDDSLIIFWITNRKGVENEMNERFKQWDMEPIATWKWLKVTKEGEPVYDFDNIRHKVPYETVVFAKKRKSSEKFDLPDKLIIASVPMAIHSHKPPLLDLLRHFNVDIKQPLELFARSLLPSTHSIGFEPFLLQSEHIFTPKNACNINNHQNLYQ
ncbi:hypothetical protein CRE_11815 [Caenorhabditis remanei]|uniref:Uncharacterized protein n=1 Tax=Caenorhabditis remanei TaxID=31234 RepID=E3M4U8_CAERE|nr:hypothetical protein CRE_11815 [Caenorhabditis remanei]